MIAELSQISDTEIKNPGEIAMGSASIAAVGGVLLNTGLERGKKTHELEARILELRVLAEQQSGFVLPDLNAPTQIAARNTLRETRFGVIPDQCSAPPSDEIFRACQVLEGPAKIVAQYNAAVRTNGVRKLERQVPNKIVTETLDVVGGGILLIAGSFAIAASMEFVSKKFETIKTRALNLLP